MPNAPEEMEERSARWRICSAKSKPSFGPLALAPFCPFPLLAPRRARAAPKLIRRPNGVTGTLVAVFWDGDPAASSSNGDSSTEPELADETDSVLFLMLKGVVCVPGRFERPSVVIESRRGPEVWFWETEALGLNMSTNDERRRVGAVGDSRWLF